MIDMRRLGVIIFLTGFWAGVATMFFPGHGALGTACWAIALFVGGPVWVYGLDHGNPSQRRQKSGV